MACASTSSLHLLSITPKTLTLSRAFPTSLSFLHSSPSQFPKLIRSANHSFRPLVATSDENTYGAVDEDVPDSEDTLPPPPELKIFVGNLPFSVDSTALAGLFEQAGTVEMVEVIYDRETGRSRGFAFVTMSSVEDVESAVQKFNGYELEGRALRVNSGPPPPKGESYGGGDRAPRRNFDNTNRVYVGNLAWSVDNFALENLFNEQGKVLEAKVVIDRETGKSRGFGFVTYSSADEVNRAIDSLNGADLDGRQIRVSVAEAPQRRQY